MEPKSIASANSAIAAFTQISLYPSSPPMSSARGAPIPVYPLPPAAQRSVPRPSHLSPIYPAHFPSHLSPHLLYSSPLHYPLPDNILNSSIPQTPPFLPATPPQKNGLLLNRKTPYNLYKSVLSPYRNAPASPVPRGYPRRCGSDVRQRNAAGYAG